MRFFAIFVLFIALLFGAQNERTLGLESFLGGNAGQKGEIELAKIRIENLKAQKAELEARAAELERLKKEREPILVDIDDPQVSELLAQIAALKDEISRLSGSSDENAQNDTNNTNISAQNQQNENYLK